MPTPMSERTLSIPFSKKTTKNTSIGEISLLLDKQKKHPIDIEPWPDYPEYFDLPVVSFSIAYIDDCIFIKYDVEEHEMLARYRKTNDPVYKDSCVEFFIAFDEEDAYYNLEFNRLGTCLGGFGRKGETRVLLPPQVLETIKYERSLLQKKGAKEPVINWTLTLAIPAKVFYFHQINSLKGKKCNVNFFKCGDDLTMPHYLAWNNIIAPEPDFHRPEFFGDAEFV
jgi:hypothetical protein